MKTLLITTSVLCFFLMAANPLSKKEKWVFEISYDYWQECSMGPNDCLPLSFERSAIEDSVKLVVPCGGTSTYVYLFKDSISNGLIEKHISYGDCPPFFDLTGLEDGKYGVYMLSCNLGGGISFYLESVSTQFIEGDRE